MRSWPTCGFPEGILIDDYTLAGRAARKYFTSGVREDASRCSIFTGVDTYLAH